MKPTDTDPGADKAQCLRVANLLDKLVREGKARRVSRGVYDLDSYGPAEEPQRKPKG